MRIKSYFDSSVQTAMRHARQEFGDDVMLVTSRVTSLESRHLGDYEVVFAVDQLEAGPIDPVTAEPIAVGFEQVFQQQLAPMEDTRDITINTIHSLLIDIGLEPVLTDALVGIIRSCAPLPPFSKRRPAGTIAAAAPVTASLTPPNQNAPSEIYEIEPVRNVAEPVTGHLNAQTSGVVGSATAGSPAHADLRSVRTSRAPLRSGLVLTLIALGWYGISRRSGS